MRLGWVPVVALAVACGRAPTATAPPTSVPAKAERRVRLLDAPPRDSEFPQAAAGGLRQEGVAALIEGAEASQTDALLIVEEGKVVVERYCRQFREPIQTRSITKVFTGMAIGLLVSEGRIASLDMPISTWFPEWNDGLRAQVKLRHLLEHTSGIEHDVGDPVLAKQQDSVQWVRAHTVKTTPGEVWSYNNDAVQLLAGIVHQVTGETLESFVARRILQPLGIAQWTWSRDPAGETFAHAGLALTARDLARVGQTMLDRGAWKGMRIVPQSWLDQSTKQKGVGESHYGLLWEIFSRTQVVVRPASLARVSGGAFDAVATLGPLVGRPFVNEPDFWLEAGPLLSKDERRLLATKAAAKTFPFDFERTEIGFGHSGSFGQFLVVIPSARVIAIRLLREPKGKPAPYDFVGSVLGCLQR